MPSFLYKNYFLLKKYKNLLIKIWFWQSKKKFKKMLSERFWVVNRLASNEAVYIAANQSIQPKKRVF